MKLDVLEYPENERVVEGYGTSIGEGASLGDAAVDTDCASSLLSIFVVRKRFIVALVLSSVICSALGGFSR